jgi:aminoglycoside phosphotransferase (APT) family kinase protein
MFTPGRLLASGRDADIFEYHPGLVLRRSRAGSSMVDEARIMQFVREKGYPVPAVHEVSDDGSELVMERIDGMTMVEELASQPWKVSKRGRALAELHLQLHELVAPSWLPPGPCGAGDRLIHLDLHPLNVMMSPKGPIVIDWANASRGTPGTDVAVTWALLAGGHVDGGPLRSLLVRWARGRLLGAFLEPLDVAGARAELGCVVEWKALDAHMSDHEVASMRALVSAQRSASS